jgi:hypothetical protein
MRKLAAAAGLISACLLGSSTAPVWAEDTAAPETGWHEAVLELRVNGVAETRAWWSRSDGSEVLPCPSGP